jgi:hypothetical protein
MYVSDYKYTASPSAWTLPMYNYDNEIATNNNWIYIGHVEWTISRLVDYSNIAFFVSNDGGML